ncbi:hypothetical protein COOONC_10842 [Cooperia oncophora]
MSEWTTVTISAVIIKQSESAGIFPWGCVSDGTCNVFWDNADGWDIMFFIVMLLAFVFEIFVLINAAIGL